jgi:hypothetical protein
MNTGRNVVMSVKKNAIQTATVAQVANLGASVIRGSTDKAVFVKQGALSHVPKMNVGPTVATHAKRLIVITLNTAQTNVSKCVNALKDISDTRMACVVPVAKNPFTVAESQVTLVTMVVTMAEIMEETTEETTVVTLNVPKTSIGNNVVTCARKNATKTVTVPKPANHDVNVTKDFSDKVACAS